MAIEAPEPRWSQASAQLGLVLASVALAALLPYPIFATWVLAYLGLWLLGQFGGRWVSSRVGLGLLGAGAILAIGIRGRAYEALPALEGLRGIGTILEDRWALEGEVGIAPPLVRDDAPQSYYVSAPGAGSVSAKLGATEVRGAPIGPGLYRIEYDPRQHGPPPEGPFDAGLLIDGRSYPRSLFGVRATAHPRQLRVLGDRVVGLSTETDQLCLASKGEPTLVAVGDGPVDLVLTSSLAIVSLHHEEALVVVDLEAGRVVRRFPVDGAPARLALRDDRLAVAFDDRIELYALPSFARLSAIPLARPDRLAFGASVDQLLVSTSAELLRIQGERIDRLVLGRPVSALAVLGDRVVVAVSDYLPGGGAGANHEVEDQLLTIDLSAFGVVARTPTLERDARGAVGGAGPIELVADDDGILVAFAGTGDVARFGAGKLSRVATFEPGIFGVARVGAGLVVSVPSLGELRFPDRTIDLSGPVSRAADLRRRGELGFYEATLSGTSCASCHPDEDSDRALHDIGQGTPRPTLSVRGIAGTSPYLRGASYPSLASLDEFAHGVLGGYRVERADRAVALAAFVESLPKARRRAAPTAAGYAAFCKAGCDECHRPPAFTDLAQYPSGFLFPELGRTRELLDTPSLIGVGAGAPYLYDGRAPTLESVFEDHDPDHQHGAFGRLDAAEQRALFAFLRAL